MAISDLMTGISRRRAILSAVLLLLLCLFAYGNTLGNGFLLDDHALLLGEDTLGTTSYQTLFTWGFKTAYRPIAFSFLKFELHLFGENPAGYHMVNILLFYTICLLFLWILNRLTKKFSLSLLCVCLFAAHPINNFLINYKTAGCLNVYVIIMQLAFIMFIFFFEMKRWIYYAAGMLLYFACLFTHEITFIFPVYVFLLAYMHENVSFRRSAALCLPFAVPFGIFFFIRSHAIRSELITSIFRLDLSFEQYATLLSKLIFWYNSKIVFPKNIIFIWDEKIAGQTITPVIIFSIIAIIVLWLVTLAVGRNSIKALAWNIYCAGFLPTLLSSFTYTKKLETAMIEPHWFVFSSIGLFLLFVLVVHDTARYLKARKWAAVIVAAVVVVLVWTTRTSNAAWKDDATYCKYWMDLNPLNGSAYSCRSRAYIRDNDRGLDPSNYGSCLEAADLAGTFHHLGRNKTSLQYYLMALKMDEHCVPAFYGLGNYYMDIENYRMAEGAFRTMIALAPDKREAYTQLIRVYELEGKAEKALELKHWLAVASGEIPQK